MGDIKRNFEDTDWILGDGAPTWVTLVALGTQESSVIDLVTNGLEAVQVQLFVDFESTPTGHVKAFFYSSTNDDNYDTLPVHEEWIDNGLDLSIKSAIIPGVAFLKVVFQQTQAGDVGTKVRARARPWNHTNV